MLRSGLRVLLVTTLCGAAASAAAQPYPSKPIRVYLPQPPGAGVDIVLRRAIDDLQARLGQPLVVENRAGGNSVVAAEACARSTPDGHAVCVLNSDPLTINPHLFARLPYDADRDFRPVTNLYYILTGVFLKADVPAVSMSELQAYAASKPGALNVGTFGPRSTMELSRLYLEERWKTRMAGVPYPGGPQIFQALAGGQIDVALLGAYGGLSLLKSGKAKMIAVSGTRRLAMFPDVPTLAELGLPDLPSGQSWWGLLAPAATPAPVVGRLNTEFVRTFRDPKFVAFLTELVTEPNVGTPEEFAAIIRADRERIGRFVAQYRLQKE